MEHICLNCKTEFANPNKQSKFCTKSCAAVHNNKLFPKRKRLRKCKNCDNLVKSGHTFCETCTANKVHYSENGPIEERTLEQETVLKKHKGANRYDYIRQHAQRVMRGIPRRCKNCNYSKHVEVCHIKAIRDFDLKTKIKDINSKENLVLLCPNCHWEFDNGLLTLKNVGNSQSNA
jgi:hypothetical protein